MSETIDVAAPAAAPAVAAPASAPAAAPAAPAAPAVQPTVLSSAAATPAPAPAAPGPFGSIPEKFHVKGEDGAPDLAASWAKVEEHRANLEQRLGAGDIRPKTPEDYKINVPDALKEAFKVEELAKDPKFAAFIKDAHAKGMTQSQLDFTIASWMDNVSGMVGTATQFKADACTTELKAAWGKDGQPANEAEYMGQVQKAFKAAKAYAGADFDTILKDYGNDARIVKLLAAVGKDLGEDTGTPHQAAPMADADVDALTKSKAYWDQNDPQHEIVKAKVASHYAAKFGNTPHGGGVTVGAL